ncbi:MAG: hypothetical protein EWV82_14025 [Microcystis aeruginosa Ma_AC_P_19900807_S299]|uniref:Uncharacterized protein n=1 Tax=Microcystis aeruginosa Ma_SC_T_19800800_S464 TaxID=2486257 RepID=A0A552E679_MICAE|nr:MAG: hypothetical protein EWV82_14025 [Microcystis aeruginosa Ma_AC_P_19900807_S299]TRU29943.1 MAG: hypothetical protein EWV81_01280 [Microcystis aeruginosa Ma_SC_T_19800800_S464]
MPVKIRLFSTLCDNQCLLFLVVLLGKALKNIFLENYPYSSSFHTETRRAKILCKYSGLGVDKERKISSRDKRDNRIQGVMDRGQSLTKES